MPDARQPSPAPLRAFFLRVARLVSWHRRLVAALLAAVAVAFALSAVAPPGPATERVLMAARDLPAGVVISGDDLVPRDVPHDLVAAGALRPGDDVAGRRTAGPVAHGEVLTTGRLVSPSLLQGLPPGTVATPVRIADAGSVGLVRSGDTIDVLATEDDGAAAGAATVVAGAVPVLAVPAEEDSGAAGAVEGGGLIVLATTQGQAAILARVSVSGRLSIVLRRH